jgi:hypothetical protein
LTKSYRLETATILKQAEDLCDMTQPQVFHVTRCSSCHGQLDLPSIHFMCKDSYHQRYVEKLPSNCVGISYFIDALPIMKRNAHRVLLHMVLYGKLGSIMRSLLINMRFSYRMFGIMVLRLLLQRLVGVC